MLDTPAEGLSKEQVMEIYGRVATTTAELSALRDELGAAALELEAEIEGRAR